MEYPGGARGGAKGLAETRKVRQSQNPVIQAVFFKELSKLTDVFREMFMRYSRVFHKIQRFTLVWKIAVGSEFTSLATSRSASSKDS